MEPLLSKLSSQLQISHDLKAKQLQRQKQAFRQILLHIQQGQNMSFLLQKVWIIGFDGGSAQEIRVIGYCILQQILLLDEFQSYSLDWQKVTKVIESDFNTTSNLELFSYCLKTLIYLPITDASEFIKQNQNLILKYITGKQCDQKMIQLLAIQYLPQFLLKNYENKDQVMWISQTIADVTNQVFQKVVDFIINQPNHNFIKRGLGQIQGLLEKENRISGLTRRVIKKVQKRGQIFFLIRMAKILVRKDPKNSIVNLSFMIIIQDLIRLPPLIFKYLIKLYEQESIEHNFLSIMSLTTTINISQLLDQEKKSQEDFFEAKNLGAQIQQYSQWIYEQIFSSCNLGLKVQYFNTLLELIQIRRPNSSTVINHISNPFKSLEISIQSNYSNRINQPSAPLSYEKCPQLIITHFASPTQRTSIHYMQYQNIIILKLQNSIPSESGITDLLKCIECHKHHRSIISCIPLSISLDILIYKLNLKKLAISCLSTISAQLVCPDLEYKFELTKKDKSFHSYSLPRYYHNKFNLSLHSYSSLITSRGLVACFIVSN